MIGISFKLWHESFGMFLAAHRIYWHGHWTPFIRFRKRYATWFGYFKKEAKEQ